MKPKKNKESYNHEKVLMGTGIDHNSFRRLLAFYRAQVYERYYPVAPVEKDNKP